MAHTYNSDHHVSVGSAIAYGFQWIWHGLIRMGENSARARVLHQVGQLSDEQLKAMGLTRSDVVKRILSDGYHL